MAFSADDIFNELYAFTRWIGYDHDPAERLAHHVMEEYGPGYVAAAKPGSVERGTMFKAIAATRRPGGGSA